MTFQEGDPTAGGWWYRQNGGQVGPVTEAELVQLARDGEVTPDTPVWQAGVSNEWKRYGDLAGQKAPAGPRQQPSTDDPKWQEIFAKFDAGEKVGFKTISILGFLFGPLYYFYKRMWRKGVAILGIYLCASAILALLELVVDMPSSSQKLLGLAANGFCLLNAKRDYWRLKRFGERMWPALDWFDHPLRLTGLIVVPIIVVMVATLFEDDTAPTRRSASQASSTSIAARAGGSGSDARQRQAVSELKTGWHPVESVAATSDRRMDGRALAARHDQAEKNCAAWLQHNFGGDTLNQYDPSTHYRFQADLQGGDLNRERAFFGNHLFMYFHAQMVKFTNGLEYERIDVPYHVCVLDDRLQVINMEHDLQAGIR